MKKVLKLAAVAAMVLAAASCDKSSTDPTSAKEEKLQKANEEFVDATVVPTYKALADKCLSLQSALEALESSKTDAAVSSACELWKVPASTGSGAKPSSSAPLPNTPSTRTSTPGRSTA